MVKTTPYKQQDGSTRWKVNGYLGTNPFTGKQVKYRKSGFKTEKSALRAFSKATIDLTKNGFLKQHSTTFKDVYDLWLQTYIDTVKESTLVKTKQKFDKHILPAFGDKSIDKIKVSEIQEFANHMRDINVHYKEYVSNVKRVFQFAIQQNLASNNPVDKIIIPKKKKNSQLKKGIDYFDSKQLRQFLHEAEKNERLEIYVFFYLLAHTGCRQGEALGLKYGDIDTQNHLNINRTLTRGENRRLYLENPKTPQSRRAIPLTKETVKLLKQWHKLQIKILQLAGKTDAGKEQFIFTDDHGDFIDLPTPRRWMQRICKHAGVPVLSPHALRHTFATLLVSQNANIKMISTLMGHSTITLTMNTYAGIYEKDKVDTIDKFSELIDH